MFLKEHSLYVFCFISISRNWKVVSLNPCLSHTKDCKNGIWDFKRSFSVFYFLRQIIAVTFGTCHPDL